MSIPALALGASQLAISAASAVAGVAGAVGEYREGARRHEENAQSARDAYILETHLTNKRLLQERQASSQKKADNSIKRMQAEATGLVAAASGGVQGRSVEQVLDDFRRSEGVVSDRIDQSQEAREDQAVFDMQGSAAKARSRVNSVPMPSLSGVYTATVRGVGSLANGYSDYRDLYEGDYD